MNQKRLSSMLLGAVLAASAFVGGVAIADNASVTIFASTARPAVSGSPYVSADFQNFSWKGVKVFIDETAKTSTATVDCKVQGKDPVTSKYFDVVGASFPQVVSTVAPVATPLEVYPGIATSANKAVSATLPRIWRMACTVGPTTGSGTSATFSLGGSLQQ